jgi:hypothetical protein
MNHLTMDELLELREPGLEPGTAAAREHLAACPPCQAESDRLSQRVARLRALPVPRPARDQFPLVRGRFVAERRTRRIYFGAAGALALAASLALAVLLRPADRGLPVRLGGVSPVVEDTNELTRVMTRSQQLEETLRRYDVDSRSIDGRTATIAARLEDQLGTLDRQLELLGAVGRFDPDRKSHQLRLWRERVGLLDALVDVHVTRASYAGL